MRLLLDTHAFIWWASDSAKLPAAVRAECSGPANALLLSVVSVWEMQIKIQLGKLKAGRPLPDLVEHQVRVNRMQILPVSLEHVLALDSLPALHKDPFDRLLIAQATVEDLFLVSGDPVFSGYPVKLLW
ncbi:MAG TPA: type II toxin-antitoxin system VapC family toxin [Pyrinomonadaceae bacterium]|jgi:PIN domain nuclease of toxin-antitoxin system|nr:type II toxin-antitoxin system VapC family toxin [Pyrinomonadaceae bacterium]